MVNSKCKVPAYVEYSLRFRSTRVGVLFAEGYELLGQALCFFRFGPGRLDGFVGYEGGDEVAEEGLAVRGRAIQMPVFQVAAGHGLESETLWCSAGRAKC